MDRFKARISGAEKLEDALAKKSRIKWHEVANKSLKQMYNRSSRKGMYQPVDTGRMRDSRRFDSSDNGDTFKKTLGYTVHYAPHVEFGHASRGGYVSGRRFLQKNMAMQRPIYRRDIIKKLGEVK